MRPQQHRRNACKVSSMQCAAKVCSKSDLSMVNLQQRALVELTAVVTQLSPDILVLFAGNNWALRSPSFPDVGVADVAPAVSALRADGVAGLGRMARQRTAKAARRSIDAIAAIADAFGLTVVVVVPEVNLGDWSRARPVGWLAGDGSRRWHELHRRACSRLAAGDFKAACEMAATMMVLDGGSSPASVELRAQAELGLGHRQRASELFAQAVDARTWDNFPSVPSATSDVQAELRDSHRHGFHVVDLTAVLRQGCGDGGAGSAPVSRLLPPDAGRHASRHGRGYRGRARDHRAAVAPNAATRRHPCVVRAAPTCRDGRPGQVHEHAVRRPLRVRP